MITCFIESVWYVLIYLLVHEATLCKATRYVITYANIYLNRCRELVNEISIVQITNIK